ncbi:hypothetical protein AURDEDRAFT_167599 [Auricularia subglabra TFB-10046 SS5]|nr:hypothetical protein AURDEDRAFT_167599 [Auricularia subglabra TFB-10046 SS5]
MSNASAVRQAIEELVKTTLAAEMRPLNAALSLQNRLPNELWCLIWEPLSAADRVSVSLVCSQCRALLYSCPRLCNRLLFYTTCHSAQCKCLGCTRTPGPYSDGDPAGWRIHSYDEASTNVAGAIGALSRSPNSSLHITFDIVPFTPNPAVVNSLIETLLSASWRLHTLVLRVCNPDDTASFLARFDVLPALRVLDLDVVPAIHNERRRRRSFALRKIELPLLEELHLRSQQHEWYPDGPWMTGDPPSVESPMLRKLTVHFHLKFDDFIRILRTYPLLSHLSMKRPLNPDNGSVLLQEFGALLRSAPLVDVEFFDINVKDTLVWLHRTFEPLSVRRFVLGLDLWDGSDTPWVFLNELGEAIDLSYSRTPTRQDLCGTDCSGRTRHLWSVARNSKARFLTGKFWLPWKRIVSLSIDATEWIAVLSRLHLWPVLENLRIAFSEEADIGSLPEDPARSIQFPRLRTVSITILADNVSVTATNVAASLRLLRLTAPLECLSIDRRIEGYDEQLFTGFAQRISLD